MSQHIAAHRDEQHIGMEATAQAATATGQHVASTCNGRPKVSTAASTVQASSSRCVKFSEASSLSKETRAARERLHIWSVYEQKSTIFDVSTHEPLCKRVGSLGKGTQATVYNVHPVVQCANAAITKCFADENNSLAVKSYKRAYTIKQARAYELNNAVVLRNSTREVSSLDSAMDNPKQISYEHVHWLRNRANGDVLACIRKGLEIRQLSLEACFHIFGLSDPVLHNIKPMMKELLVAAARNQLNAFETKYGRIMPTNFLSLLLRRQKFYAKEPMCLARCQGHQNVCGIFGMFEEVTESAIRFSAVMPCYSGGELFSFIDQKWPQGMPETMAREIFLQLISALKHCKDIGRVIHRDIKLENVLLRRKHYAGQKVEIVLADFGLSMLAKSNDNNDGNLWMSTSRVGTPQYWAPELWPTSVSTKNNFSIDTRKADVWALACVLHVLITGYPAWEPNPWQCERMRYFKAYRESRRFEVQFNDCANPDATNPEIVWGHSWMFMKEWGDDLKTILGRMLTLCPHKRPSLEDLLGFAWLKPMVNTGTVSTRSVTVQEQEQDESETESEADEDSEDETNNMNTSDYNSERSSIFENINASKDSHSCGTNSSPVNNSNQESNSIQVSPIHINISQDELFGNVSSHP